jgi:DNA-binding transcriptional LysR family regulator
VELRHLRYFIAVAEESTFIAAAKRLRIAQPALTRQIHDLEREVGVELFDRGARGVGLTAAGEVCLASARHILGQVRIAADRARGSSRGIVGRCTICVGPRALASGLVARIAASLYADYPGIEVVISEGVLTRQWAAIQVGDADIGIGFPANSEFTDLASETLDYDVFDSAILPSGDARAQRATLLLSDLKDLDYLAWNSTAVPDYRKQERAAFARAGFKPARTREFADIYSVTSMIIAGQGWTLYPSTNRGLVYPGTAVIPLEDFKLPLPLAAVSKHNEQRPVVRTVLSVVRRIMSADRAEAGRGPAAVERILRPAPDAGTGDIAPKSDRAIELRHLRYFRAVVESKSFGRAAERLEITQPALSRQMRDLESAIGVSLLERETRGVTATAAGESFIRSTRRILDEADALPAEAQRARRGMVARCMVGAVATKAAQSLLNELIRRCALEHPHIEIVVEDCHTPMQPAAIRSARIDLGLCHASPMSSVEERGLHRDRLQDDTVNCALVPAGSDLAQRKLINFHELADIPFIFPDRSFQPLLYDQLFSIFATQAFVPRIEQAYEGLKTAWTMVADGRGWCIGFESQSSDPPSGTVAVHVNGFAMPWGLDVLSREDESRTSILLVLDALLEISQAHELLRITA